LSIDPSEQAIARFQYAVPAGDPNGKKFFPIIPDMRVLENYKDLGDKARFGEDANIGDIPFPKMNFSAFERRYKKKIKERVGLLVKYQLDNSFLSFLANFLYAKKAGYKFVREALYKALKENDLLH